MFQKSALTSREQVQNAVFASAALAPVFKPIQIGDDYYLDGGVLSNTPVGEAINDGHKNIYVSFLNI